MVLRISGGRPKTQKGRASFSRVLQSLEMLLIADSDKRSAQALVDGCEHDVFGFGAAEEVVD